MNAASRQSSAFRTRLAISMSVAAVNPKSMTRPKVWSEEVEDAYRFQIAGYRDGVEYKELKGEEAERWTEGVGFVKKLQRKDGCFYYFNRARECPDKEVHKCKLYAYE